MEFQIVWLWEDFLNIFDIGFKNNVAKIKKMLAQNRVGKIFFRLDKLFYAIVFRVIALAKTLDLREKIPHVVTLLLAGA